MLRHLLRVFDVTEDAINTSTLVHTVLDENMCVSFIRQAPVSIRVCRYFLSHAYACLLPLPRKLTVWDYRFDELCFLIREVCARRSFKFSTFLMCSSVINFRVVIR